MKAARGLRQKVKQMKNRFCLVVVWFGDLPPWLPFFLKSCSHVPSMDWLIFTDASLPESSPTNVLFQAFSKSAFETIVGERMDAEYKFSYGYKLCDLKPAYGDFFQAWLKDYEYWGYCDLDIVVGDPIRLLQRAGAIGADVITASKRIIVGHFTLIKNTQRMRTLYRDCPAWREKFCDKDYQVFDEADFSDHVKQLAREGQISLAEVAIVQEDTLIRWSGRSGYVVCWKKGRLLDLLAFRELGYFHFIKTKYEKTLVPATTAEVGEAFVLTATGFKSLESIPDWVRFLGCLTFEFGRTIPWYCRQLAKSLIPEKVRRAIRTGRSSASQVCD